MKIQELLLLVAVLGIGCRSANTSGGWKIISRANVSPEPLMVPITLIHSAVSEGAVCMDGTPPAYHFHPGAGKGNNSWIVNLEGGGWCNNMRTCRFRAKAHHGSSAYMEKQIAFTGIMSNKPSHNPDFYNWNRVKIRYCDSASFAGEGFDKNSGLYFRGQRIWAAAIQHLFSMGMGSADKVLLTGCSAGGLAAVLHCDEFREFFPAWRTTVKCLADAGLFLDVVDVSGARSMRSYYGNIVAMQGVARSLPRTCTNHLNASSCFFPQNLINGIKTPTFLLNSAYDVWQIQEGLAPNKADPKGLWHSCKFNHSACSASQMKFLQGFRNQMISAVKDFSKSKRNGLFINSCFDHCQSENQNTWHADDSPAIRKKGIATSIGDWYFGRAQVKAIDCPYPCDKTCHHLF